MLKTCPTCLSDFLPSSKHPNNIYCSRSCSGRAQRKLAEKPCEFCGTLFRPARTRVKFCGKECGFSARNKANSTRVLNLKPCLNCGNLFDALKKTNMSCSAKCRTELRRHPVAVGQVYGNLTFLSDLPKPGNIGLWLCKYGVYLEVRKIAVLRGNTRSCGCMSRQNRLSHGKCNTGVYRSWCSLKARCSNQGHQDYKYYGGRGITFDPRWERFEEFEADMGEGWSEGLTIDRIDVDGPYCKENCRWVGRDIQAQNKRNSVLLTAEGKTQTLAEWAREKGIYPQTLYRRYRVAKAKADQLTVENPKAAGAVLRNILL